MAQSKRKSSEVRDPIELIGGGAKGEYAIEGKQPKKRTSSKKDIAEGISASGQGSLETQFHPLAEQFNITDFELQFVDAVMVDPYRNATQAWMLLRPNCDSLKVAKVEAMRILAKPNVRSYMKWCTDNNHTAAVVTKEFVMLRLRHVVDRAMGAVPVFDKDGQPTGEYKSDFNAANKALELLGKQQGMFKEESRIQIAHDRPLIRITVAGRQDDTPAVQPNDHIQSNGED